jgi:hypothetical protein
MKPITRFLIELLLRWDKTIPAEMRINIQDALYNIKEREMVRPLAALRMLGCSRPTLKKYVQKGWIREIRISYANRFYDKADIDRLIQYGPPSKM